VSCPNFTIIINVDLGVGEAPEPLRPLVLCAKHCFNRVAFRERPDDVAPSRRRTVDLLERP
jgi:hypothetical protein